MPRPRGYWGLLACGALALACPRPLGTEDGGTTDAADAGGTLDAGAGRPADGGATTQIGASGIERRGEIAQAYCERTLRWRCEKMAACGFVSKPYDEECLSDAWLAACHRWTGAELLRGKELDPVAEQRCRAVTMGAGCSNGALYVIFPDCLEVFRAVARLGEPCDERCAEGRCSGDLYSCGVCVPRGQLGEPCVRRWWDWALGETECAAGLRCLQTANGYSCQGRKPPGAPCQQWTECASPICVPGLDGGHCGPIAIDQPCTSTWHCDPNAYCHHWPADAGGGARCRRRVADGAPCDATQPEMNFTCDSAVSACIDGICQQFPESSRAMGQSCGFDRDCVRDAYCDREHQGLGTCVPRVPSGGMCPTGGPRCEWGTYCNFFSVRCIHPGVTGDACTTFADCLPSLTCIRVTDGGSECRSSPLPNGAPCAESRSCESGSCQLVAGERRCAEGRSLGAGCATHSDCSTGNCALDAGTCAPKLRDGAACAERIQCEGDECRAGICVSYCDLG